MTNLAHIKFSSLNFKFYVILALYALLNIYSWPNEPQGVDPINFATALDHYNISTDSPHAPGYPLYVGLARLASYVIGKTHAYHLINLAMVLLAAVSLYLLANKRSVPQLGIAAALLLITHPLTMAATVAAGWLLMQIILKDNWLVSR
jgi:hypothetical protein